LGGFILFYMGINVGVLLAPLLASRFTDTPMQQNYKLVFGAAGVGMLLSLLWFWFGRRGLHGVGRPAAEAASGIRVVLVLLGVVAAVPLVCLLLTFVDANGLQWLLGLLFVGVAAMLIVEACGTTVCNCIGSPD
jgi:POT family proton-dependent oligopeptide transporter